VSSFNLITTLRGYLGLTPKRPFVTSSEQKTREFPATARIRQMEKTANFYCQPPFWLELAQKLCDNVDMRVSQDIKRLFRVRRAVRGCYPNTNSCSISVARDCQITPHCEQQSSKHCLSLSKKRVTETKCISWKHFMIWSPSDTLSVIL
jgi:hypothetical protein